jgi:hypothetical protein
MVRILTSRCHRENDRTISALLIEKEPTNLQAQSLSALIDKGVARGSLSIYDLICILTIYNV